MDVQQFLVIELKRMDSVSKCSTAFFIVVDIAVTVAFLLVSMLSGERILRIVISGPRACYR